MKPNVKRTLISLVLIGMMAVPAASQHLIPQFKAGDKVALVGDSITHGGHYHSYVWLYYMTRFPDMPLTFYNCGVGGDTASNILYRMYADVLSKEPTYITLTFGMNDTGYMDTYNREDSQILSDAKVKASLDDFVSIADILGKDAADAQIVMIGGSPYDETSTFNDNALIGKNDAICRIIDAQRLEAEDRGWSFVDFNTPMVEIGLAQQAEDPKFSFSRQDRIHPDQDGQMVMAYLFLKAQGLAGRKVAHIDIDARRAKVRETEYCVVSGVEKSEGTLSFDYLAEALPYPCDSISEHGWANIRSQRDAMDLVPFMEEFNQETLRVRNLAEGTYRLSIDGDTIDDLTAEDLEEGVNLAAYTNTPQYRQASAIMYMNEERFEVEKRLREYVWMHNCLFRDTDQIYVDDAKAIEIVSSQEKTDVFVAGSNYWYRKSWHPEIRKVWQDYMDILVDTIYTVNKPKVRRISLERI